MCQYSCRCAQWSHPMQHPLHNIQNVLDCSQNVINNLVRNLLTSSISQIHPSIFRYSAKNKQVGVRENMSTLYQQDGNNTPAEV